MDYKTNFVRLGYMHTPNVISLIILQVTISYKSSQIKKNGVAVTVKEPLVPVDSILDDDDTR